MQSRLFDYLNKPKHDNYSSLMQMRMSGGDPHGGASRLMQTINPAMFEQTMNLAKKPPHHLVAIDEGSKFRNRLQ